MQQTNTYKLNLIEKNDPFSPDPLNENAQKVEAALDTKADSTETGQYFASLAGQISALESGKANAAETSQYLSSLAVRISTLETHRIAVGTYIGDGAERIIDVGFTPPIVFLHRNATNSLDTGPFIYMLTPQNPWYLADDIAMEITEGGIHHTKRSTLWNMKGPTFFFAALA